MPETLNYEGDFNYNIAITKVDCRIDNLSWVENLKLFDKICVFSPFEKQLLKESGIKESKIFAVVKCYKVKKKHPNRRAVL